MTTPQQEERDAAASAFACWYVAGPLENRGLFVERLGPVMTVVVDGRECTISVTAEAPR